MNGRTEADDLRSNAIDEIEKLHDYAKELESEKEELEKRVVALESENTDYENDAAKFDDEKEALVVQIEERNKIIAELRGEN